MRLFLLALGAELLHLRRCWRLRNFLFHGCRFPWTALGALATTRLLALALVTIALTKLWSESTIPAAMNSNFNVEEMDRLIIALDASLSMDLRDGGPNRDISRGERAAELIKDLLVQNGSKLPRTTLIVFADKATPLAVDTNDLNVIRHGLNNRGLSQVLFDDEQTTVGAALESIIADFAAKNPDRSTALLLITDGDSEDEIVAFELPASIRRAVVVGVGSDEGKLIGNFQSRQDADQLQRIAQALGGRYFDGNETAVPEAALGRTPTELSEPTAERESEVAAPIGTRSTWALVLLGAGSVLLVGITVVSPFLNPANLTPMRYEKSEFLSEPISSSVLDLVLRWRGSCCRCLQPDGAQLAAASSSEE